MITTAPVTAILPVSDMARAAAFYRDRLGLEDVGDTGSGNHALRTGSGMIELMAAEDGAQSAHTVLSFEVDDVSREVAALEGQGVQFQDVDLPNLKTVDHIASYGAEKAAWFNDSEGNVICVHQQSSS